MTTDETKTAERLARIETHLEHLTVSIRELVQAQGKQIDLLRDELAKLKSETATLKTQAAWAAGGLTAISLFSKSILTKLGF